MFGAISEKFRTFDIASIFAIPPIFTFPLWLGESCFPITKIQNSNELSINLLEKFSTFHDSPYLWQKSIPLPCWRHRKKSSNFRANPNSATLSSLKPSVRLPTSWEHCPQAAHREHHSQRACDSWDHQRLLPKRVHQRNAFGSATPHRVCSVLISVPRITIGFQTMYAKSKMKVGRNRFIFSLLFLRKIHQFHFWHLSSNNFRKLIMFWWWWLIL